jgi:amino acid transporter
MLSSLFMFDDQPAEDRPSRLRRLLANPATLRRRALAGLLALALLSGVVQALDLGPLGTLIVALTWVGGPLLALGLGAGEAFFIQYGRGVRRAIATVLSSVCIALAACAAIPTVTAESQNVAERAVRGILYALLFVTVFLGLGALLALGIGRSGDYLARRISNMSDDDW